MDCTIVNMYPGKLVETKPGVIPNRFEIDAPKTPGDFTVTRVTDAKYQTDPVGGRPSHFVPILAEELAESIVHDFVSSKIGVEEDRAPGIFWVSGVYTKEKARTELAGKIEEAKQRQDRWFLDQIVVADSDWARKRSHLVITQDAKWAAKWLGQEREWLMELKDMIPREKTCIGCSSKIPVSAIICSHCSTIQDQEKYKALKIAG